MFQKDFNGQEEKILIYLNIYKFSYLFKNDKRHSTQSKSEKLSGVAR